MPSNVRVAVRVRPMLAHELTRGERHTFLQIDKANSQISVDVSQRDQKNYKFDKIIDDSLSQAQVFDELQISGLINKVIQGYHSTVFAYGQTGSGKTFTMEGYQYSDAQKNDRAGKPIMNEMDTGLSVRAIREIFKQAAMVKDKTVTISCSFLQIYNEKVYDLLNKASLKNSKPGAKDTGLKIRWSKNEQFAVENLFVFRCNDEEHAIQMYNKGVKNKIVASHNLNHASSRSHAIFSLQCEITQNNNVDSQILSKLQLVDLAGSERSSQTGNTGLAAKEAIDINKSLFTLRQVITSLAEQGNKNKKTLAAHIPYRDSKLTSLLKQSLGGNSYCLMVACLSPADSFAEENISTLNYANKASQIQNIPSQNVDPKQKIINELREKCRRLQQELEAANNHIQMMEGFEGEATKGQAVQKQDPGYAVMKNNFTNGESDQQSSTQSNAQPSQISTQSSLQQQQAKQPQPQVPQNQPQQQSQNDVFHRLDAKTLSDRMVESVNMVKTLMAANRDLRQTIETQNTQIQTFDADAFHLQNENRDCRDRIEMLESVVASSASVTDQFDRMDWRAIVNDEIKAGQPVQTGENQAINHMVQLIFDLRKQVMKQDESQKMMNQENQMLRGEIQGYQDMMAQQVKQAKEMREKHMNNPYHGGFEGQDSRDPFGQGAGRQQLRNNFVKPKNVGPQNQDEALKMLTDMMNKRTQKRM